jgi:NAD(P)-dependent dehydrogenase (short-subunit alcohol dehydrogenase family)
MRGPMPSWSAADIPDLSEKLAIVTGANSGLGLETARALARRGAKVIMACRTEAKAKVAIDELVAGGIAADRLEHRALDLSSLASIRRFAEQFLADESRLDLLINNAGVMALPYSKTADGFEMQIGTNHLGHFALTGLLLEPLRATAGARVVTVSSLAHKLGTIRFNDLHWERGYDKWRAYGQSKLANLLFGFELARRLESDGAKLLSVAAHPGYAATNLQFVGPQARGAGLSERLFRVGNRVLAQDAAAGALPTLYAATAADVRSGEYFGPSGVLELQGPPKRVQAEPAALDREVARRLWALSAELTDVRVH